MKKNHNRMHDDMVLIMEEVLDGKYVCTVHQRAP
jgi:hypothetical protein